MVVGFTTTYAISALSISAYYILLNLVCLMVFNTTVNNISVISWRSVYWWRKPEDPAKRKYKLRVFVAFIYRSLWQPWFAEKGNIINHPIFSFCACLWVAINNKYPFTLEYFIYNWRLFSFQSKALYIYKNRCLQTKKKEKILKFTPFPVPSLQFSNVQKM
jgi:hypothetical protein